MISTNKIIKFIIDHVDNGTISEVEKHYIIENNCYDLGMGVMISKEMLDQIKENPEHFRKMI